MTKIRTLLVLALLVLLPPLPVRAYASVAVTFQLTVTGLVGADAGFSVLYHIGASSTTTEAVFCGQALLPGHPAGAPCRGASAVYMQRVSIAAGTSIHFDVVQSAPTYELIVSGTAVPSEDTRVVASYPHAASAVPVTFQLAVHIKLPGGVYFAVTYPYEAPGGQKVLYDDLPLCSTAARPTDRAYAKRCLINGGISSATVFLPSGTIGRYVFYAFRWGSPPCLVSALSEVHVARTPILIRKRVISGGSSGFCGRYSGGAGLQFD